VTKFKPGDDIVVDFKGVEVPGEVKSESNGWVMAVVAIDPEADWGSDGPRLDPRSTICVPVAVSDTPNNMANYANVICVLHLTRATSAPTPRHHHPSVPGFSLSRASMTSVDMQLPENRVTLALAQARKFRHHKTCRCRHYQGYCSPNDALWSRAVDRELDEMGKATP